MIRKIASTFTTNVLIALLNFFIAVIVSQYLGAAGKGQQSILITTIAFILLVCNIAGGATLVYLVPRYDNFKIIAPSYVWSFIVCVLIYFVLAFLPDIPKVYVLHICLLTFINSLTAVNSTVLLGHERINAKNIIALLQTITLVFGLLMMFVLFNHKSIEAFIFSLYLSFTAAFVISCLYVYKYLNAGKANSTTTLIVFKEMLKYGFLNQLSHITQLFSFRLSYYILLFYIGKDSVGVYSNAVALVESVWLISKSIATVQYARIANTEDDAYAKELTRKLLKMALLMSFIILLPLALLPSSFYMFVFGTEFGQINRLILTLSPGVFIYNFSLIIGHYFSGKGRYHINTIASSVGLVITLLLCLVFVPLWGVYGAAFAAVMSFAGTSFYVFYVFSKESAYSFLSFLPDREDMAGYKSYIMCLLKNNTREDKA